MQNFSCFAYNILKLVLVNVNLFKINLNPMKIESMKATGGRFKSAEEKKIEILLWYKYLSTAKYAILSDWTKTNGKRTMKKSWILNLYTFDVIFGKWLSHSQKFIILWVFVIYFDINGRFGYFCRVFLFCFYLLALTRTRKSESDHFDCDRDVCAISFFFFFVSSQLRRRESEKREVIST